MRKLSLSYETIPSSWGNHHYLMKLTLPPKENFSISWNHLFLMRKQSPSRKTIPSSWGKHVYLIKLSLPHEETLFISWRNHPFHMRNPSLTYEQTYLYLEETNSPLWGHHILPHEEAIHFLNFVRNLINDIMNYPIVDLIASLSVLIFKIPPPLLWALPNLFRPGEKKEVLGSTWYSRFRRIMIKVLQGEIYLIDLDK